LAHRSGSGVVQLPNFSRCTDRTRPARTILLLRLLHRRTSWLWPDWAKAGWCRRWGRRTDRAHRIDDVRHHGLNERRPPPIGVVGTNAVETVFTSLNARWVRGLGVTFRATMGCPPVSGRTHPQRRHFRAAVAVVRLSDRRPGLLSLCSEEEDRTHLATATNAHRARDKGSEISVLAQHG